MTDRIVLDRSPQILRIEVPVDRDWTWDGEARGAVDPVLTPRIPDDVAFVSAAELAEKAKQFGDGLYASVERSSQIGMEAFGGKSALLRSLAARLAGDPVGEAIAVVARRDRAGRGPHRPTTGGAVRGR